jgi:hypothetical protein
VKRKTLNVSRPTQNTIGADGTISLGTPTTLTVQASVQPADRVQLETLPQLRDFKQVYTLFSSSELFTADAVSKTEADKVSIYGKEFEVITVEPWLNNVRSHYKIMVGR